MSRVNGHKARKRFGQNFLHDPYVINQIMAAISPKAGDRLVEIGPGLGALTEPLLAACQRLHVVELDRDLIPALKARFALDGELVIHQADALQYDFAHLAASLGGSLRIVGNLPYNISTPLLFHLLSHPQSIQDMHFMLQKEVVDRLAAAPGSREYGRLSVMVQYLCRVRHLFDVSPGAFNPPPKVTSAVVRLEPVAPTTPTNLENLNRVVTTAFNQRRKTLRNSLKTLLPEADMVALGIDPQRRPETLSVMEYVALANILR